MIEINWIENKLRQPMKLPQFLFDKFEKKDEKIIHYAFSDLNEYYKLQSAWLVLTATKLYYFNIDANEIENESLVNLDKIKTVYNFSRLSAESLYIETENEDLFVRYTLRQKNNFQLIYKFLTEITEGKKPSIEKSIDSNKIYSNNLLLPIKEKQKSIQSDKKGTFFRLVKYLMLDKKALFVGVMASVIVTLLALIPPYISGMLVDKVIKPFQNQIITSAEAYKMAMKYVLFLFAIVVFQEMFAWLRLRTMSFLGEKVAKKLRDQLYSHIQKQNMRFFSKKQTGSLINRVSSDSDRIWEFIAFGVIELGISVLMIVSLSFVLISLDWKLGLVMITPVPFVLYLNYRHSQSMQLMFLKVWRKWSRLTTILSDAIPGMMVVKTFSKEKYESQRFGMANHDVTEEFNKVHERWTRFWPMLMLVIQLTVVLVWFFALPRVLTESETSRLSVGVFVSFLLYMTMFSKPIDNIGQITRMMNRALSSAYRVFEILDHEADFSWQENSLAKVEKGKIEFKNVRFSYDGVRPVLNDLSFCIQPGEMIGLVGNSGGGKSTITKLISRFYDVSHGDVLIDGVNVKDFSQEALRSSMAIVLQESILFHGSIAENIAYGKQSIASEEEIIDAAKIANAHDFIMKLPHAYNTIVGERGHNLSGGERQRVCIARAIIANPKILILDEATSAVDTETERNIQLALDRIVKGRTVIAIAHRLSTLRQSNRIFVVKEGRLVESGPHQLLSQKQNGEYKKLLDMQKEMNESFINA